jgi:hypothetical protein
LVFFNFLIAAEFVVPAIFTAISITIGIQRKLCAIRRRHWLIIDSAIAVFIKSHLKNPVPASLAMTFIRRAWGVAAAEGTFNIQVSSLFFALLNLSRRIAVIITVEIITNIRRIVSFDGTLFAFLTLRHIPPQVATAAASGVSAAAIRACANCALTEVSTDSSGRTRGQTWFAACLT